jgi:hypothetical protein
MESVPFRKILCMVALALTLLTTLCAETKFEKAELLSITSGKGLDNDATHRWAFFTVQIGNVIYTGSGKRIKHKTDNYQEGLSAGDAIEASVSGNDLILRKPNGGEVKTRIVKKEPAP